MTYTVGEMAKRLGVAPSTLRYYDQQGLLPFVERSESGARVFRDADFEWLQIIGCLKQTGMRLADIRHFIELAMRGDETIEARLALICEQKQAVQRQMETLGQTLETLEFKQWYYETARAAGTTKVPANMAPEELPERFRPVRRKLRGE